jgi:hypothetical protein
MGFAFEQATNIGPATTGNYQLTHFIFTNNPTTPTLATIFSLPCCDTF